MAEDHHTQLRGRHPEMDEPDEDRVRTCLARASVYRPLRPGSMDVAAHHKDSEVVGGNIPALELDEDSDCTPLSPHVLAVETDSACIHANAHPHTPGYGRMCWACW